MMASQPSHFRSCGGFTLQLFQEYSHYAKTGYQWNDGQWEPARPGYRWNAPHWEKFGFKWLFVPGRWEQDK